MDATPDQLVGVIRRLIDAYELRKRTGEDTIGVLLKCGAFHEFREPGERTGPPFSVAYRGSSGDQGSPIVELARAIDEEGTCDR